MNLLPCLLVSIGFASGAAASTAPLPLVPVPAQVAVHEGRLTVTPAFRVTASGALPPAVAAAVARLLAVWQSRTGMKLIDREASAVVERDLRARGLEPTVGPSAPGGRAPPLAADLPGLVIAGLAPEAAPPVPALGEDESYTLEIAPAQAKLQARTASGVYRGLASLQQLLTRDAAGWYLPAATVHDQPRFPWRGLLVDVSRRWEPVEVIERNLDGMALVKLNVLHFHLTDDQGFRVESKRHPELTSLGSDGHFYTQGEIRRIVAYAAARGIRVVPEFDLPGHATSWLVSHPELSSGPGPYALERHWGVFDPVMDPTNEGTYRLLSEFLGEMAPLFPDLYVHLGGDENNGVQWSANPRIQAFIRSHQLGDNPGLHAYFNQRVGVILQRLGKRMIGWDEILHPDLPRDDVIESWQGPDALGQAARQGFAGILANGFYLDLCHPASDYYRSDPLPAGNTLSTAERARVLGGEGSMWGEWVSPETIDSRIWPRAAAVAERLWSPAEVRDSADLYRRLEFVDLRLAEAGLHQRSYVAPAARRLLGGEPSPRDVDTLIHFLGMLEPVQDYNRGKQQPGSDQWTPLVGMADAARPDSAEGRWLALGVSQFLADPSNQLNTTYVEALLRRSLRISREVAGTLAARSPGIAPAGPLAEQCVDAAQIGLAALHELARRAQPALPPSPPFSREAALARLTADAEPHDALTLALIDPIRQLVLATAAP